MKSRDILVKTIFRETSEDVRLTIQEEALNGWKVISVVMRITGTYEIFFELEKEIPNE